MADFDTAVGIVLGFEGGYVDDPQDSGNATNFGISSARYPGLDVSRLTRDQAINIYRRDFWDAYHCGEMPWPIALLTFDSVVQFNPGRPIAWLQTALGIAADGLIGPDTINAANTCPDPLAVAKAVMASRSAYRETRPNYAHFGAGWRNRDAKVLADAEDLCE